MQILTSSEAVNLEQRTIKCHSCDVSISGMRIELDREIPINSMVDLWASFEGMDDKYYLRGHVCWCYEMGGDSSHYQVGVELDDAFATDYTRWVELMRSFNEGFSLPLP